MRTKTVGLAIAFVLSLFVASKAIAEDNVVSHLQNVSVTIKSGSSFGSAEGSGVIVTRELKVKDKDDKKVAVNFVLTAGHVVDNLRSIRTVVDPISGQPRQKIEFKDAAIVKELIENGRRVGEVKMEARVIKYSDADHGHDVALLMVRKRDYVKESAEFYLEGDKIVPIGTPLFHVGSLLGQTGANSMTTGIMSQVGRVVDVGAEIVFDQTSVTAFPGSSGGGVFNQQGKYVGMLVRGGGETFNLIVPVRRLHGYFNDVALGWVLDPSVEGPSLEQLSTMPVEDAGFKLQSVAAPEKTKEEPTLAPPEEWHFLIRKVSE